MLEHETANIAPGGLAARAQSDIFTIGTTTKILNRTFLIKKMEIEFSFLPAAVTDDAGVLAAQGGMLCFQDISSGTDTDTVAEALDADLEDQAKHQSLIWTRNFVFNYNLIDDADNIVTLPTLITWKTSKSFPKGFPLDKSKSYKWTIFNQTATWLTGSLANLRVRYFGVYL